MTGNAFAQEWSGRGAGATEWDHERGPEQFGRRGGPGRRHHGHHEERCGRHGRPGDVGGAVETLLSWALAQAKRLHGPLSQEELEHIENLVAWRRMRGGQGGFGGPGGPFGRGPRGRGRRRRGDVRLAVLRLLNEEPRNGYQLMQAIEERSGDTWRPSPGSMYPTLAQLEDEGLIRSTEADGSRRFEITDAGREHLQTRSEDPDPWEPGPSGRPMSEVKPLIGQLAAAAMQVASMGDEAQRARAVEVLSEARRALYRILAEEPATPDEPEGSGEPDQPEG